MRTAPEAAAEPVGAKPLRDDLVEDLAANVRLASAAASACCRSTPDDERCDWYHGFYPLLRRLGAAATPERHADFYARALAPLAGRSGFDRVLIPGAADSGMLKIVLSIQRRAGARASIHVLDRCGTPLVLCRHFAEHWDAKITTEVFDLIGSGPCGDAGPAFDVACTHSLLVFFPPDRRRAGIEACRARLRPGGKLVSTVRIDPTARERGTRLTRAGGAAFASRLREAALAHDETLELAPETVFDQALRYAERMVSWPYASAEELASDFAASGFSVDRLDLVEVLGRLTAGIAGAGTHRRATYAEFVVSRI